MDGERKTIRVHDLSLEEKLLSEQRRCSDCRFVVFNPFVERCPRCYKPLEKLDLSCKGCFHGNVCPAANLERLKEEKEYLMKNNSSVRL